MSTDRRAGKNRRPSPYSKSTNFAYKLYNMVEDDKNHNMICWSRDGCSFQVLTTLEFASKVLPKNFKHSNLSSFVRQLNMYGFHKANRASRQVGQETLEFSHPLFIRGRPELLDKIKRNQRETQPPLDDQEQIGRLQAMVYNLETMVEQQRREMSRLREMLEPVYQHYISQHGYYSENYYKDYLWQDT